MEMAPKPGERTFERPYARILLEIANEDLESSRGLFESKRGRAENIVFLAQQAIEKSLKAVLCHFGIPIPLVHDLGALIAKMPGEVIVPMGYELTRFNDYAGILRYERGHGKLSVEDIDAAIAASQEVCDWAKSLVCL